MLDNKVLLYLYIAITCEKLSFHAIRYTLVLYIVKDILWTDETAYVINGSLLTLTYLSAIIGGWLADNFSTNYKVSLTASFLMFLGITSLLIPINLFFYIGLGCIACGEGFLRANLPAILSKVYSDKSKYDSIFTLMYASVNIGAFLSVWLCCLIGELIDWKYGFLSAALISLLGFIALKKGKLYFMRYEADSEEKSRVLLLKVPSIVILCICALWSLLIFYNFFIQYILLCFIALSIVIILRISKNKLFACYMISSMVVTTVFIAFYEQGPSSINLFIDRAVDKTVFNDIKMPTVLFQVLDPAINIVLGLLLCYCWWRFDKGKALTLIKLAVGVFSIALSFYILSISNIYLNDNELVPSFIILVAYIFLILGEELVIPVSMSFISKISSKTNSGTMLGVWNVSIAAGQLCASLIAKKTAIDLTLLNNTQDVINSYCMVFSDIAEVAIGLGILILLCWLVNKLIFLCIVQVKS